MRDPKMELSLKIGEGRNRIIDPSLRPRLRSPEEMPGDGMRQSLVTSVPLSRRLRFAIY